MPINPIAVMSHSEPQILHVLALNNRRISPGCILGFILWGPWKSLKFLSIHPIYDESGGVTDVLIRWARQFCGLGRLVVTLSTICMQLFFPEQMQFYHFSSRALQRLMHNHKRLPAKCVVTVSLFDKSWLVCCPRQLYLSTPTSSASLTTISILFFCVI